MITNWLADATFDTVPGEFRQMFTVHESVGPNHVNIVPIVFVLMAFLPAEDVPQGLALLDEQIPEVMRPLVTYLENTYALGRIKVKMIRSQI